MKQWLLYAVVASILTAVLYFFAHFPIGYSAFIAFLGWPIVGTIVTSDDDLPGGWSNPDGTAIPAWETPEFWGRLFGGAAIVSLAFAVQVAYSPQLLPFLVGSGLVSAAASAYLLYRSFTARGH